MQFHSIPATERFADTPEDVSVSVLVRFAEKCERIGFEGLLIPDSNAATLHPLYYAHELCARCKSIRPFIALNPAYSHPFAVAKYLSNLSSEYNRRFILNMITSTNKSDLSALGDDLPHDDRYDRLIEYSYVLCRLLAGERITYSGRYYSTKGLSLTCSLPPRLVPEIYVAGASEKARYAVEQVRGKRLQMAKPVRFLSRESTHGGVHLGIVARETGEEAWRLLHERYTQSRKAQIAQQISLLQTDSVWKQEMTAVRDDADRTFTLLPFANGRSDVPYLIGSYQDVAEYLQTYNDLGFDSCVIEIPRDLSEELIHLQRVLSHYQSA